MVHNARAVPRRITKKILYEKHALKRLKQRAVDKVHVEAAISDPTTRRPAKRPGAVRITYKINQRETLNVIVEETDDFIRVVTAWI